MLIRKDYSIIINKENPISRTATLGVGFNFFKVMIETEGIMIFKDTMEYLIEGIISAEQYAELTRLIYTTRWGDGVDIKTIKDKNVLMIWKTLQHTVKKSKSNAKHYKNCKSKNNTDIQPNTEFEDKPEISPNKPLKSENDTDVHQGEESVSNGQEIAKNEELEINTEYDMGEIQKQTEIQEELYDFSDKTYEFIDNNKEFFKGRINAILDSRMNPQDKDREIWSKKAYDNIKEYLVVNGFKKETLVYKEVLEYVENKVNQTLSFTEEVKSLWD